MAIPTGLAATEKANVCPQIDSIIATEISRQLTAEQIDLKIERMANEKFASSLAEQNKRLTEHDHEMSSRFSWIGILVTLFSIAIVIFGLVLPYMSNKRYIIEIERIKEESKAKVDHATDEAAKKTKVSEIIIHAFFEKDPSRRIELYSMVIGLDPENSLAYNLRGYTFNERGDTNNAIIDFNKAIELNPEDDNAFCNRGFVYLKKGDYSKAIMNYNKAIELASHYTAAYNYRGYAYYMEKNYDKAIEDFEKAIELDQQYPNPYCHLGAVYRQKGEYERAIDKYSKAIELKLDYAKAYYERGLAYKAIGQDSKATSDFKNAKRFGYK